MATDKSWVVINLETSKYPGTTGVFHVRDKAEALELADLLSMLGCRAYWHSPGYYPEDLFDNVVDDEAQFKLSPVSDGLGQALSNPDVASPQKVLTQLGWAADRRYQTLLADGDTDLTNWRLPAGDGTTTRVNLTRLRIYPIILNPSGRMAFARVARSRITYLRQKVDWTTPVNVGRHLYSLTVRLPTENCDVSNIHLELKPSSHATTGFQLQIRFDGVQGVLAGSTILQDGDTDTPYPSHLPTMDQLREELADPAALTALLHQALKPFKYGTLGRDNHNAADFFPTQPLHLTLFRFGDRSVPAATPA